MGMARSQARILEAVREFDRATGAERLRQAPLEATLSQMRAAHLDYRGFGVTDEFLIGIRDGERFRIVVSNRAVDGEMGEFIQIRGSDLAEPMRRALRGEEGIALAKDYRGVLVLAAHVPAEGGDLGVVAKLDIAEIRSPYIRAGLVSGALSLVLIGLGVMGLVQVTRPAYLELRRNRDRLALALSAARIGVWEWDVFSGTLHWDFRMCQAFGLDPDGTLTFNDFENALHPADRERVCDEIEESWRDQRRFESEFRIVRPDGAVRHIEAVGRTDFGPAGDPVRMTGVNSDVTDRAAARREMERLNDELRRSNAELEQFAYVASHDLQEPLRMVSSYTQLLERRYGDQLDEKAGKYIYYAVDGARRMQQLINDLLQLSRVTTRAGEFERVDMLVPIAEARANLSLLIEESAAEIEVGEMPEIEADASQLAQVFQNLIGNAIKFRGSEPPRIEIRAEAGSDDWTFSVSDNGIGFDPQYAERVFTIFQRLHSRGEYEGTGIGLALCKRIVERHGGMIRAESKPGAGATIFFSLPKERPNPNDPSYERTEPHTH